MTTLHVRRHPNLASALSRYEAQIDAAAGEARARHITTVAGQAETYLAKAADAEAYVAAGYPADPAPGHFPWVQADAEARALTPQDAADSILAQRDAWTTLGVEIERIRMSAKTALHGATGVRAMAEITDNARAQLQALGGTA